MLNVLLLAGAILNQGGAAAPQDKVVEFHHRDIGFIFSRPASWQYTKLKSLERFMFTAGDKVATLDIMGLSFSGEPEIWQSGQADAAKQMRRDVLRQWQEEILGVPMLLTQTSWIEDSTEMESETALIYAATARKFIYRLTAPKANFDQASYLWRNALQTLKTDDGVPPKTFDRSQGPNISDTTAPKRSVYTEPKAKPAPVIKGTQVLAVEAGGSKLELHYPEPWKVTVDNGKLIFKHASLSGQVTVEVLSMLDSLPPGRHLLQQNAKSLEPFTKVNKRTEPVPSISKAGMTYTYIVREGLADKSYIMSVDGIGANEGQEYFALTWSSRDQKQAARESRLVLSLANELSVDIPK